MRCTALKKTKRFAQQIESNMPEIRYLCINKMDEHRINQIP